MKMPNDFQKKLSKLGDKTDEIVSKVLESGGELVLGKVKSNLKGVIGSQTKEKSRSTGELVSSLGLSPTKVDRNGNYNVKIGFSEPRSDGDSNAKIANILEYGKSGQQPKPFLKPAKSASRKACIETMKMELDKEIEKL
jgi:HK97 gp10 family phage protein